MIAKNGKAIIDGEVVPRAEVTVLRALAAQNEPLTVPQVTRALEGMSEATVYSLMGRLHRERHLVTRTERMFEVCGARVRRILWEPTKSVRDFFQTDKTT